MTVHDHSSGTGISSDVILALPFAFALVFYAACALVQWRRGRSWPWYRSAAWAAGIVTAASGFVGPLAGASHGDFVAHMWTHLLVGMAAPLLLVLGAPVTLILRSIDVGAARRVSRALRSWPARFFSAPVTGAILTIGGMWMLYATPLYAEIQGGVLVHLTIMTHHLLAGYLFTAAIIPVDPAPHRAGFALRTVVMIVALAAHGILAKTLYAHPPAGVSAVEAQAGAQLMFYAGDIIDAVIIVILCAQWYRASGRDLPRSERRPSTLPRASRPRIAPRHNFP
ncbi:cytochrome c oxidase assembly protein [Microbacterium hydrocarbonoxydans]|uniref:cytochrome c oxidase assembly protein n=1 Tax=Microbacterium hydrocarbonoxydans TaxID=273678 RepID=UPI00203D8AF2|nr:cytochrome c oxidase assembly protein [Microbacterium hydrocarbonoxydans]MCM3781123.1 cytochrome c oxidase assembly protein [Microbacterium hydrocarbonoxydans]